MCFIVIKISARTPDIRVAIALRMLDFMGFNGEVVLMTFQGIFLFDHSYRAIYYNISLLDLRLLTPVGKPQKLLQKYRAYILMDPSFILSLFRFTLSLQFYNIY